MHWPLVTRTAKFDHTKLFVAVLSEKCYHSPGHKCPMHKRHILTKKPVPTRGSRFFNFPFLWTEGWMTTEHPSHKSLSPDQGSVLRYHDVRISGWMLDEANR